MLRKLFLATLYFLIPLSLCCSDRAHAVIQNPPLIREEMQQTDLNPTQLDEKPNPPQTLKEHPDLSRYTNPATKGSSITKKVMKGLGWTTLIFLAFTGAMAIFYGLVFYLAALPQM